MLDFNPAHFTSTFNSSPYYNGNINGFDIMVMDSSERADKVIEEAKAIADRCVEDGTSFSFTYNDDGILESDQMRIEKELERYCRLRNIKMR